MNVAELSLAVAKIQPEALVYDGSFDGFLSVVFEATRLKLTVERIVSESCYTPALFEEPRSIATDLSQSARVWQGIVAKGGQDIAGLVRGAFLSEIEGVETLLWHYLRKIFADPQGQVARNVLDDHTHQVLATARKVQHEAHLMTGFVRFEKRTSGMLVAVIEPQYNVVELLAPHFIRRFPAMVWMIVDGKRGIAVEYNGHDVQVLQCDASELPREQGKVVVPGVDSNDPMSSLWKAYYDSVNISERRNTRLMTRLLPRKYWQYLPERNRAS